MALGEDDRWRLAVAIEAGRDDLDNIRKSTEL
jgi:hypothetical protein